MATLGPSIRIHGDLRGEEDLLIQGQVEGKIHLRGHKLTVGEGGRIKADIRSKSICVEGEVEGDLHGEEEVIIRPSGRVAGNLFAPRVTLEDGSRFKGSIDMEPEGSGSSRARSEQHRGKGKERPSDAGSGEPGPVGAPGRKASEARSSVAEASD